MPLDEDDVYLLADATDLTPFAEYISPNEALLCPLKITDTDVHTKGYHAAMTPHHKQDLEGTDFAIRHFRSQLSKGAVQQRRTPLQWQGDVYSVFTGFDRGGGFVTGSDFKAALDILGVNISYDLLAGMVSPQSIAFRTADLINYEQILCDTFDDLSAVTMDGSVTGSSSQLLQDLNTSTKAEINYEHGGGSKDYHNNTSHNRRRTAGESTSHPSAIATHHSRTGTRSGKGSSSMKQSDPASSGAVKALVSVVRRGMEKFIINGSDIEDVSIVNCLLYILSCLKLMWYVYLGVRRPRECV